jgi:hypothetical protein
MIKAAEEGRGRGWQRKDVADMIKAAAAAFGFDPARFSTSSARRFAGSNKGLSKKQIKVHGGWDPPSTVNEAHYQRDAEGKGTSAVEGGEFSQHQLEGLARRPLTELLDFSSGDEVDDDDPYDMNVVNEAEQSDSDAGTGDGTETGDMLASWSAWSPRRAPPSCLPHCYSPEGAAAKRRVLPASLTGSGQKGPKTRKLRSPKQSPCSNCARANSSELSAV